MDFPTSRFIQAGANVTQIAALSTDFAAMPEAGQQSFVDRISGLASGDLYEMAIESETEPGTEVIAQVDDTPDPVIDGGDDQETDPAVADNVEAVADPAVADDVAAPADPSTPTE